MGKPIVCALLGSGLFAQDVYVRLIAEYAAGKREDGLSLEVKAVWSRSASNAQEFVSKFSPQSLALSGEAGLQQIMQDTSIRAVMVVLPVPAAVEVVKRALAAGKHVMQEKPVADNLENALQALQHYRQLGSVRPVWMIAENYRFEAVFLKACQILQQGRLGEIIKLDLVSDMPMNTANKYYTSQWRRDFANGQMIDSGVHFIAGLRMVAAAAGLGEAVSVSASTRQAKADLSDPDTCVGLVRWSSSQAASSVSISLAAAQVRFSLTVCGTNGSLEILRGGWAGGRGSYTLYSRCADDTEPQVQPLGFSGTNTECGVFLQMVQAREAGTWPPPGCEQQLVDYSAPEEGLRDLALLEALMSSGAQGGQPVAVKQI